MIVEWAARHELHAAAAAGREGLRPDRDRADPEAIHRRAQG